MNSNSEITESLGRNESGPGLRLPYVLKNKLSGQVVVGIDKSVPANMIQETARASRTGIVPFEGKNPPNIIAPCGTDAPTRFPFLFPLMNIGAQLDGGRSSSLVYEIASGTPQKYSAERHNDGENSNDTVRVVVNKPADTVPINEDDLGSTTLKMLIGGCGLFFLYAALKGCR